MSVAILEWIVSTVGAFLAFVVAVIALPAYRAIHGRINKVEDEAREMERRMAETYARRDDVRAAVDRIESSLREMRDEAKEERRQAREENKSDHAALKIEIRQAMHDLLAGNGRS